jgi:hypothetical protein
VAWQSFISALFRCRIVIVAVAWSLGAAGFYLLMTQGLREEFTLESLVESGDPDYLVIQEFSEKFISSELGIVAVTMDDPLSEKGLALFSRMDAEIRAIKYIDQSQSILSVPYIEGGGGTLRAILSAAQGKTVASVLEKEPERRDEIRNWLMTNPLVGGNLISKDGKTVAVFVQMAGEEEMGAHRKDVVEDLRALTRKYEASNPEVKIVLAGQLVTLIDIFDAVHRDLLVFTIIVLIMIGAVLMYLFRRVSAMVMALSVAGSAIMFGLGLAILLNISMTMLTQLEVILVTVNTVATCVHLMVARGEIRLEASDAPESHVARETLDRLFAPCTVMTVTTALGFGSLIISDLVPVKDFAILLSTSVMVALVTALGTSATVIGRGGQTAVTSPDSKLAKFLGRMALGSYRHRVLVVILFIAGAGVAGIKIPGLRFESDFVKNFKEGGTVYDSYDYVVKHLTPVSAMDVVVEAKDGGSMLTPELLEKVEKFGDEIQKRYDTIPQVQTLTDVWETAGLAVPSSTLLMNTQLLMLESFGGESIVHMFMTPNRKTARLMCRAYESGVSVYDKLRIKAEVEELGGEMFGSEYEVTVTGLYPFYAKVISGLLRDQLRTFGLAIGLVLVALWVGFRSFKLAMLALIPNTLPMVFVIGFMGWTGVPINMGTAMILSVSLGIAVDDTVHYLWRYRRELRTGKSAIDAMVATHQSVGKACIFTTVVITLGFWVMVFSNFVPTAYFGGLVGVSMIGALGVALILWPLMLVKFHPTEPSGS